MAFAVRPQRQIRWWLVATLVILLAGAGFDAYILFRYDFAVGVDGYYYQLQIKSLLSQGRFYFPTRTPLVLYLLSGFSYLTGESIVTVKVVSIFLHATLSTAIFALVSSATRMVSLGLCAAALCVTSGTHLYLVGEYVNNLGALALLVWSAWCALRFFQTQSKFWLSLALLGSAAALFSHRSSWAIIPAFACTLVLVRLLTTKALSVRLRRLIAALLLLIWSAPALLAAQRFIQLPGWLDKEFLIVPKLPFSTAAVAEQIILIVIAPITLLITLFSRKRDSRNDDVPYIVFGAIALCSLLLTINPFFNNRGAMDFTWRLSILAYIQVALLVPGLIWLLLPFSRRAIAVVCAFVLPLIVASALFSRPYGLRSAYLSEREELLYRLPLIRQELGSAPLVISPHGDQFVVTWALGIPSQQEWSDNRSHTIYWLLHHVEPDFLASPATILAKQNDGKFIGLAKHEIVRQRLAEIRQDERQRLLVNNSHLLHYVLEHANR